MMHWRFLSEHQLPLLVIGGEWADGRMDVGCGQDLPGSINSEFHCVAISMTVENCFAGMVEYDVGEVGRE